MDISERTEAVKEAVSNILIYGDNFRIRKNDDGIIACEIIDEEKSKKIYKTRAILRRYNNKSILFAAMLHMILFGFLLFLFLIIAHKGTANRIGINIHFLDHWFTYIGLLLIYFYVLNRIAHMIRRIHVNIKWKSIFSEFQYIKVDDSFLQNEFGNHKEYIELVSVIADKLSLEKEKSMNNYYNKYET